MTSGQLLDLLIAELVRQAGGTRRHWRHVIGPVRIHDPATHPHCNWSIYPTGSAEDTDRIERLLDDVRLSRPIVTQG